MCFEDIDSLFSVQLLPACSQRLEYKTNNHLYDLSSNSVHLIVAVI
jgi:hypothetical protein